MADDTYVNRNGKAFKVVDMGDDTFAERNSVRSDGHAGSGGVASWSRIVSAAATTNATSAKASAGRVYHVTGYNAAASVRYLKFYNKASAPTVGTDTPLITIALPATAAFSIALGGTCGAYFSTGIAYAMTTAAADADTGALTAADVVGLNVGYV